MKHDERVSDALEAELLKRRAKALAAIPRDVATASATTELLIVRAGGTRYALPLTDLSTVVPVSHLAPLPGAPHYIAGLAHLQGQTVSIISLPVLLGHPPDRLGAAVLVETSGELVGIGVEGYESVRPLVKDEVQPSPRGLQDFAARVVEGMLPGGIVVLDVKGLIQQLDKGARDDATTR